MAGNIEHDSRRFSDIVKGHVRKNLKQYIVNGSLIDKDGSVRIPLPHIDLPKFIYEDNEEAGIGQGEGEVGDSIFGDFAGDGPNDPIYEANLSLEDLAEIMDEKLELEELKPKSIDRILQEKEKYKSTRKSGPESLRHFKRTYKNALKRIISTGEYDPNKPKVIPIRQDKIYRSWIKQPNPSARALIIHGRDISGSIDEDKVDIIRNLSWWIDLRIRAYYKDKVNHAYIVHNTSAWELSREEFFDTHESGGGTIISSAFKLMNSLFQGEKTPYNHELWNIYIFYYSDGENYDADLPDATESLEKEIFPYVNTFCYGHISKQDTNFLKMFRNISEDKTNIRHSEISKKIQILDALRKFLGPKDGTSPKRI